MSQTAPLEVNHYCAICLEDFKVPKRLECGHIFCENCINTWFVKYQPKCPSCGKLYGPLRGDQPPGIFAKRKLPVRLPSYEYCGTIEITYCIHDGIQTVSWV